MKQCSSFSASPTPSAHRISSAVSNISEIRYPFGVQNDLGQVVLRGPSYDDRNLYHCVGKSSKVSFPYQRNVDSPSRFSEESDSQSTSEDISVDAFELEKAIKENDVIRVKHYLVEHRGKFQLRQPHDKISGNDNEGQESTPLLSSGTEKTGKRKCPSAELFDDYSSQSFLSASLSSSSSSSPSSTDVSCDGGAASADGANNVYKNALHLAVEYDSVDVVKLLLRHGVDPESKGVYSHQPAQQLQHQLATTNVAVVAAAAAAAAAAVALDADNNHFSAAAARLARCGPSAVYAPIGADDSRGQCGGARILGESAVSCATANNVPNSPLHYPLQHVLPKSISSSLASKGAAIVTSAVGGSPKNAALAAQKFSREGSPQMRLQLLRTNVERAADTTSCSVRNDAKESGTKMSQTETSCESVSMLVPRRVSWVPPHQQNHSTATETPHRRQPRHPFNRHLVRQRSFSLESHGVTKPTTLDTSRKCVSLKSSPQISAHGAGTLASGGLTTGKSSVCSSPASSSVQQPKPNSTPERSIMAELRRSSEIFKSILMNLSIKEMDSQPELVHSSSSSVTSRDVDVDGLLATHRQRCIENYRYFGDSSSSSFSSSSFSSSSNNSSSYSSPAQSPDRSSCSGASESRRLRGRRRANPPEAEPPPQPPPPSLRVSPNLPTGKLGELSHAYDQYFLYELPPLFLALARGNAVITGLLLKYGANPNYQDLFGNAPLHIAACQSNVPWECILQLLESSAQICLANHRAIRPIDLTLKPILQRLQSRVVDSCWTNLVESISQHQAVATSSTVKSTVNPTRILRKLRSNAAESVEEGTSCASGGVSTPNSGRSRSSNRSVELTKKEMNVVKQKLSEARRSYKATRRKEWRDAVRKRQPSTQSGKLDESRDYMVERSLKILILMSSNPECLGYLVRGLLQNVSKILNLFQQKNDQIIRRAISTFLHNTLRTAVSTFPQSGSLVTDADELERNKKELVAVMCYISKICLYLIHSVQGAQYTAMLILNKIIDLSVIHQLTLKKTKLSTALQHPCKIDVDSCSSQDYESPSCFARKGSQNRSDKTFSKRPSFISKSEPNNQNKNMDLEEKEECVLDAMTSMHASSVLNTLHNALTLFKRVISSHRTCTPSKRSLNCSHHCLQLLSGRVLVFMTQSEEIQDELLQEQQLRILAQTLEVTHDPQLLLLMLQVFANAALHPKHHKALVDHGIPDLLSQLLLPSDDYYYNAHSTKYGLFVKHHVSRVLVYLGLQHRVNHKYSVFDYHIQEELKEQQRLLESQQQTQQPYQGTSQNRATNAQLLTQLLVQQLQQEPTRIPEYDTESETPKNEKDYITYTSICPSLVVNETNNILYGISVENAVYNTLRVIESTLNQPPVPFEFSTLHWVVSGFFYGQINSSGQLASRRLPTDPNSILFAQNFMFCFPFVMNPVVVLRLLSHRLMTTAPLHRWKSSASRSSFGSVITHGDVPRSPRSRASSTETETSTLRKRRKVNLTLDCANWANDINAANDENCSSKANRPTPRPSQCRDSSISSASGLGIEPAMQAISAVSNMLRYAPSRDSIRSTGSCDERGTYLALNLPHKARNAFRFSSLKHPNKRRSKSQANICKMEHASQGRETAEQDILAFQKQLQNLPDFDSPDNPNNANNPILDALNEFISGRLLIRPRSRSMPKVTCESSRYLALPDTNFGCRLPRGRSAGALGFPSDLHSTFGQMLLSSPVTTPTDDRRPSGVQPVVLPTAQVLASCNSNSRRSSLSPASDRNNRRRDSPACLQMEVPSRHRAILSFVEDWMKISRVELEHNTALTRELREFLSRVATCGAPYQQWCAEMRQEFPTLNKDPDLENVDDYDDIDREYCHLVNQVISGALPCNKEEAAVLAGIHLRIEETWGRSKRFVTHSPVPLTPFGDEDVTTLKPISEDKESFLLEVPTFGGHTGPKIMRPVSPLAEDAENEEENDVVADSKKVVCMSAGSAGSANSSKALEDTQHAKPSGNSLLRKCYPSSSNQVSSLLPAGRRIEDFLPPSYLFSKGMGKLIKEQKRKLFHAPMYESELQLKKLYVQTCKRLPAYNCRIFHVKEMVRGKTKKKSPRLLGLSPQKAVLLDDKKCVSKIQNSVDLEQYQHGRSHDRLVLEFRSARWSLIVPTAQAMREIGNSLWQILQEIDTNFLEEYASVKRSKQSDNAAKKPQSHSAELEALQDLLQYPEEIALTLTEVENNLFYQVPPIDYLRQVTLDPDGSPTSRITVNTLADRFRQVSTWFTNLILMQGTFEDRKAVLSCILRVAITCWNIGNFNGATEILAAFKSIKMKPFLLSISDKDSSGIPLLDWLVNALRTPLYDEALTRALKIPQCQIIPFFGSFIREINYVGTHMPNLKVLAPNLQSKELQKIQKDLPDLVEEDHYLTLINPAGLINLEKMYEVQNIMDRIAVFHQHYSNRERSQCPSVDGIHSPEIERTYNIDDNDNRYYETEMDSYRPIQPVNHDHGVCTFPVTRVCSGLNSHILQILHHGTTAVHWDVEGSRSCYIFLRLERNCSVLSWRKPYWAAPRPHPTAPPPDFQLNLRTDDLYVPGMPNKAAGEIASFGLEEGFLDLSYVKELYAGAKDKEKEPELTTILKRHRLESNEPSDCCMAMLFGTNVSDNRTFYLLFPPKMFKIWMEGLCNIIRGLKFQLQLTDRRIIWLKEQYVQLHLCDGNFPKPTIMDAIRVFGGRDWSATGTTTGISPPENGAMKRGASIRFRKKRSIGNLQMVKGELVSKPCDITDIVVGTKFKQGLGPGTYSLPPPSRSRSICSDIDAFKSPQGSTEHVDKTSPSRRERKNDILAHIKNLPQGRIIQETHLDFSEFVAVFKSFSLRYRKDIRELFDKLAVSGRSVSESSLTDSGKSSPEHTNKNKRIGLLTRNNSLDYEESKNSSAVQKKKIFDAIATASITSNLANVDTSRSSIISLSNFSKFLETKQCERLSEPEVINLIQRHEPDPILRCQNCLSYEGFARYLMDKDNYAYPNERMQPVEADMDKPLSHYYIASSHNTYLTGHQLKGESSVDLYTQVLLAGCRCVELDCWDGDDGNPLIYHGHTFTTKIPFKAVVEAINKAAFITSPYPVILSLENHCSIQQQARMAQIFQSVFGDKLIGKFLFDVDFSDEPHLPSPASLKNRILIKNKKLMADITPHPILRGVRAAPRQPQAPRASSIASNTSGGSLNDEYSDDDEDDDDDDDDNLDMRTDSLSSHETPSRNVTKISLPYAESEYCEDENPAAKYKKQNNQISKDLSDIIIYIQAIKFRGLNTISPSSSVRYKRAVPAAIQAAIASKKSSSTSSPSSSESHHAKQRLNMYHPCYQCASLNENAAKKLCRKQALALIAHTETQLVRTYPAGMRIDSSNFNPVIFWSFGIQMVALNYQTEDTALHLNTAMFEQNGRCGYVLKPSVMCDRSHMMYRRFNPWDKEFDGLHSSNLILHVISGQYVSSNFTCSVQVEVELIGIPVDSCKQKTKIVQRNSLNPLWNDTFYFQVMFRDLTFVRFNVIDANTSHVIAQRVIPLKHLRPGYRHVRLRNNHNQPLFMSTLFIYSRSEEESVDDNGGESCSKETSCSQLESSNAGKPDVRCPGVKRRMFFLMVYGVVPDEASTILKITQESSTQEVILQALQKAGLGCEKINDYVLVEEVSRGWEKKDREVPATQRVLDPQECPLQSQAQWQGEGRFLLKRLGDDPSSRAWLSSIRSTRIRQPKTWDDADNFLVCVYNVSDDIPYAILKVPVSACAQDVLAQALIKARRLENPAQFVLVEELEYGGNKATRLLADDENVYSTQAHWPTLGRFILHQRDAVKKTRCTTFEKLSKGLAKLPVGEALSDPPTSRFKTRFPLSGLGRGGSAKENAASSAEPTPKKHREVHSEGEAISDEDKDPDFISTMSRLKRLSIRKFRAWKS